MSIMTAVSDYEHVQRAAAGDPDSFEYLYLRYRPTAHRIAYKSARSAHERGHVEDAVSVVFVWLRIGRWRLQPETTGDLSKFVATLATYALRHVCRPVKVALVPIPLDGGDDDDDGGAFSRDSAALTSPEPNPEQQLIAREEAQRIAAVLATATAELTPLEQRLLRMRFTEALSYGEIAKRLGRNPNKIGELLVRARRRVSALLGVPFTATQDLTFRHRDAARPRRRRSRQSAAA
jgi:RNA polymerase sigma factor (sigma-70 family)